MSAPDLDQLSAWQFELPPELIASRPATERDGARLLVVDRVRQSITHSSIRELPQWLHPNDLLIFNNTRVLPARLFGLRAQTGGKWEGLYVEEVSRGVWHLLCETRGRLQPNEIITVYPAYDDRLHASAGNVMDEDQTPSIATTGRGIPDSFPLRLLEKRTDGGWLAEPQSPQTSLELLEKFGSLPLPPYMGRKRADSEDQVRYQTAFATEPGAVAAPTAGLHFTPELLAECESRGISRTEVTLHVGIGTFRPVSSDRLSEHVMHEEWCRITPTATAAIEGTQSRGGRIVAVGTTSVRTVESSAKAHDGLIRPWEGRTNLFIRPGYAFQAINCLLTNFHLPGSTLIVLVAALAGYDLIMEAYRQAIAERYRFYSYGDAMLIL
ncbi:MAG: tRNA preQ1(34) S-adenosylmethionine ribosyltransferase-isomerase QueA [Planctomycetota bacterium]